MALWIPITIAAAFVQNLRFMLQKVLTRSLSTMAVTAARFLFAAPFAAVFLLGYLLATGQSLPAPNAGFLGFAILGGLAQIIATALLIALFSLKNFAVGVTLSKTEVISTVIASALILGEGVPALGLMAILITLAGVLTMTGLPDRRAWTGGILGRAALIGIASGAIFSLASVGYRGAALALESGDVLARSATTLAAVTLFQAAIMALWLGWREAGALRALARHWRPGVLLGLLSMLGSLGWFTAFTLQNAAYVKALGQIELLFTVAASALFFKERIRRAEAAGIALVALGIVALVLA